MSAEREGFSPEENKNRVYQEELKRQTDSLDSGVRPEAPSDDVKETVFEGDLSRVDNFRSLYSLVNKAEFQLTTNSGDVIDAQDLLRTINRVRDGEIGSDYITRKYGLRRKVEEIIRLEKLRSGLK